MRISQKIIIKLGAISGWITIAVGLLVFFLVAFSYQGRQGEYFSTLNHFISELGEEKISKFAWVFNSALKTSGILLVFYNLGMGVYLNSKTGWLTVFFGVSASVSCFFVGQFPIDRLALHIKSAISFFNCCIGTMIFFSIAILVSRRSVKPKPLMLFLFSTLSAVMFGVFLSLPKNSAIEFIKAPQTFNRPDLWSIVVFEWLSVISILLWVGAVSWYMFRVEVSTSLTKEIKS